MKYIEARCGVMEFMGGEVQHCTFMGRVQISEYASKEKNGQLMSVASQKILDSLHREHKKGLHELKAGDDA